MTQMKFKVEDGETIEACLLRMKEAGYMPIKRYEKPVFKENKDGSIDILKQEIIFTGKKMSH